MNLRQQLARSPLLVAGRRQVLAAESRYRLTRTPALEVPETPDIECEITAWRALDRVLIVKGRVRSQRRSLAALGVVHDPGRAMAQLVAPLPRDLGRWLPFDVTAVIEGSEFPSAWHLRIGTSDGRWWSLTSALAKPLTDDPVAHVITRFVDMLAERPAGVLLEIGSRERSGNSHRSIVPPDWTYLGLDVLDGPNVDLVGDAHRLGTLVEPGSLDAVMSISTFEHLLMPWKVVLELNRALRTGGLVFIGTHQTWSLHDAPWDFWRYSSDAWAALFNPATGFTVEHIGQGQPASVVPLVMNAPTADLYAQPAFLSSTVIARKTGDTTLSWPVDAANLSVEDYPA